MAAFGSVASAKATGTSVTVTKPTGLASGDLMVAFVTEGNSGGTPSTPSGWTLITNINAIGGVSGVDTYCFAKIADSGDAAASNFTFSYSGSSTPIEGILYRITGTFAATNNIYTFEEDDTGTEVSDVFDFSPGITPNVASSLLIFHAHGVFSGTNTSPVVSAFALETSNPTWTEDVDGHSNDDTRTYASAHATRTETTATGYYQVSYSVNVTHSGGILLAIADTSNGTATPSAVALTATPPTPTSTGGANVTVTALSFSGTVPTPTTTGGTNDALWKNTGKPSAGTISNTAKP